MWASLLLCASLTLTPAVTALFPGLERCGGFITCSCFTVSLELLLLVCCLYTHGDWFAVAGVSVLFGLTLVFGPFALHAMPAPEWLCGRKTSAYLTIETALLILLLLVCRLYTGGHWFVVASVSVLFALGFVIWPVLLRQLPLPEPFCAHKLLLYFAAQSVMLLLTTLVSAPGAFLREGLPVCLLCLSLPWGVMAAARYLPLNGCFRAAVCCAWTVLWCWSFPWTLWLTLRGDVINNPRPWAGLDLTVWGSWHTAQNVYALTLIALGAATLVLCALGFARERKKRGECEDFGKKQKD